jgi:hypothetical protein
VSNAAALPAIPALEVLSRILRKGRSWPSPRSFQVTA